MGNENSTKWKPGDPIGYVRKEIPEFDVPAYEGECYKAMVPDTLDLQERATLAINGLTGPTNPEADYEMYFGVNLRANPPTMSHGYADHCTMKFMEALPLMRIITGSDSNVQVDRRWMEVALHQLGPDGFAYLPTRGRPWATLGLEWHYTEIRDESMMVDQIIDPIWAGRLLSAMSIYGLRDGGTLWKDAGERLVDALAELAVDRGRYAYFAPAPVWAERGSTDDYGKRSKLWGAEVRHIVMGLIHLSRSTGYQPALTLAEKLIRYTIEELCYFGEDGRFLPGRGQWAHFHQHTAVLLSMLEYAQTTGDPEFLELVQRGYDYAKASGDTLLGYFPEWLGSEQLEHSELCEVADMIALSLKMTEAGLGDYLDDADRWVRNMFAEGQLTPSRADWLSRQSAKYPASTIDPVFQTAERVAERNVGAFAGWPKANDWGSAIMHCCTGNSARSIYYIWERIVDFEGDGVLGTARGNLRVNLLLNRASPWADVDSHIPYAGQVDVKIKVPARLSIRIPEWATPDGVRVQVNGDDRRVDRGARYVVVGEVKPGDVATMTFPIAERTNTVWIEKEKYTIVRKGNDVVAIDPPGQHCPLYQREHYRMNSTRWRKLERFASREIIRH